MEIKRLVEEKDIKKLLAREARTVTHVYPWTDKEGHNHLQFWGWEIVLLKDGTYFLSDTSGG